MITQGTSTRCRRAALSRWASVRKSALRTTCADRPLAQRVRVVAAEHAPGPRPSCRPAAAARPGRTPRCRRRTGRGSGSAAARSCRAPRRRAGARRSRPGPARTGSCRRRGRSRSAASSGTRSKHAAEDQRQHRQVGLGGHAGQPVGHPPVQPRPGRHVPRVHEDRRARPARSAGGTCTIAGVVEVAVADVVADLDADVPGGQAAVQLGAGRVRVLQRHLAERHQPVRRPAAQISRARSLKIRATFTACSAGRS